MGLSLATIYEERRRTVCFSARVLVDKLEGGSCSLSCMKSVAKIQKSYRRWWSYYATAGPLSCLLGEVWAHRMLLNDHCWTTVWQVTALITTVAAVTMHVAPATSCYFNSDFVSCQSLSSIFHYAALVLWILIAVDLFLARQILLGKQLQDCPWFRVELLHFLALPSSSSLAKLSVKHCYDYDMSSLMTVSSCLWSHDD